MQSRTSAASLAVALCALLGVSTAFAQAGEVLEDGAAGRDEAGNDRSSREADDRERRPGRYLDDEEVAEDEEEDDEGDDEDAGESGESPYRVGADHGFEVGGHVLVTTFTTPRLPSLNTGLGFQGRIAIPAYGRIVAEANVGFMFNPEDGSDATYKTGTLRIGGRYPIDLRAEPVLIFFGAGIALNFLGVTRVDTTGASNSVSAIAPAFDVLLGMIYELTDRLGIELIVQGNYMTSTVVMFDHDASWFAFLGGVSYDL